MICAVTQDRWQHAPDEHLLAPLARQALQLMTALFWDLGEHRPLVPSYSG